MSTIGLLLAAGAGRRYGQPKALVPGWLEHAIDVLREGGCDEVRVVLGAEADHAAPLLPAGVAVTIADDWQLGMGASLRAGLGAIETSTSDAVLVHLVDLPDVTADVVARLLASSDGAGSLTRAAYNGRAGHPVLIGRGHWNGVRADAEGDSGARGYLRTNRPDLIECGDLATGVDVDRPTPPEDLGPTRDQPHRE